MKKWIENKRIKLRGGRKEMWEDDDEGGRSQKRMERGEILLGFVRNRKRKGNRKGEMILGFRRTWLGPVVGRRWRDGTAEGDCSVGNHFPLMY